MRCGARALCRRTVELDIFARFVYDATKGKPSSSLAAVVLCLRAAFSCFGESWEWGELKLTRESRLWYR